MVERFSPTRMRAYLAAISIDTRLHDQLIAKFGIELRPELLDGNPYWQSSPASKPVGKASKKVSAMARGAFCGRS